MSICRAASRAGGQAAAVSALDGCERVEPLSGQVLGRHDQVGADSGVLGETLVLTCTKPISRPVATEPPVRRLLCGRCAATHRTSAARRPEKSGLARTS
ncbi:hypothetical protein ACIQNT_24630 [Streptomyces luteogriseus]|uniref:hypothetical protein n=1 Tax=Streptomyces luteogriseus TaxID=68233 RepID=UPI00382A7781